MNVTCSREKLLLGFQTAASVAPAKSPKTILQNIKFEVSEEESTLIATDMEIGIRISVPDVEIKATGTILLPVTRFGPILRESSDERIHIQTDGQGITVRGDHSEFTLPAENPSEFPAVSGFSEERFHEVPARLFKELVRRTLFATDTESSRYALGGVLFEMELDRITAVGTDGRRLAKMEGPAQSVGDHQTGDTMTIVPGRSLQLIDRAILESDAEIQVAARGNDIILKNPRGTIYSRLVEGRFPRWKDVLPDRQDGVDIGVTVGPLYSAVRQAAVVASEESRGIDFTFGKGTLVLSGSTAEVGKSRVEFPVPYEGEEITMTLDHRFVSDFLRVLPTEKTVTVNIKDAESAALFSTDDGYGYVVMPLAREK